MRSVLAIVAPVGKDGALTEILDKLAKFAEHGRALVAAGRLICDGVGVERLPLVPPGGCHDSVLTEKERQRREREQEKA